MVELQVAPHARITDILVGTSIRKPWPIVAAYLAHLAQQELPPNHRVRYCFYLDTDDPQVVEGVTGFVDRYGGIVLTADGPIAHQDFNDQHPVTHQWQTSSMRRVGAAKDQIILHALDTRADYLFFADADLLLDRCTLRSLLAGRRSMVAGVYWTKWQAQPSPELVVHAGPQVWLRHPYQLDGRGYEAGEFRQRLIQRQLTQVWGQGACTLIARQVLEAGVTFAELPELPKDGMWVGEDRHFCVKAERLHIEMWADPWPDIFHVYHPGDIARIPEWTDRLSRPHPDHASLGDLVNLILDPLEPVPVGPGRFQRIAPQYVRGRLGALALLPELEEAVYGLQRGGTATVPVHFPSHYELVPLRGARRLIRLTLVDCKPFHYAPVIETELYLGQHSGAYLDHVSLTPRQHEGIREMHGAA